MTQKQQYPSVSVKALLKRKDVVLILQHPDGTFDFPGGRVELGEKLIDALYRELQEELSINLKEQVRLFDVWDYIAKDKKRHSVLIYYICELTKRPKLRLEKGVKALWLTKNEFFEKQIIKDPKFLEQIFQWQDVPDKSLNTRSY